MDIEHVGATEHAILLCSEVEQERCWRKHAHRGLIVAHDVDWRDSGIG